MSNWQIAISRSGLDFSGLVLILAILQNHGLAEC
jgi:hypothetical protein